MNCVFKTNDILKGSYSCLLLLIDTKNPTQTFKKLNDLCSGQLDDILEKIQAKKEENSCFFLPYTPFKNIESLLFVFLGKDHSPAKMYQTFDTVAKKIHSIHVNEIAFPLDDLKIRSEKSLWPLLCQYFVQQCVNYSYKKNHFQKNEKSKTLQKIIFMHKQKENIKSFVDHGLAIGEGIKASRYLGDLPSNICTPTYLSTYAKKLSKQHSYFKTTIIDEKMMKKLGMNSFLAVSTGSQKEEGKLIIIEYKNGKKNDKPYVFLGKGITFDAGGISIKPSHRLDEMKYDMCGAASVFGVMEALAHIKPAANVIGVIAAAENMPSGEATKPGDIVTSLSGKTIEILNTDAEGRLVLCDALTYIERFNPKVVIDIATLTGASIVALGHHTSALFSNDEMLAQSLFNIGNKINDPVWQLPMNDLYDKQLKSPFADVANISNIPAAGTIVAACFLARFAHAFPWAHLDIAGTAWTSGQQKGATGRPVPLLVNYLLSNI